MALGKTLKKIIFGEKKIINTTPLDPELIKRDETVKSLAQKVQAQQVQIAEYASRDKLKKEKDKEKDKESEFNKKLIEQAKDLKANIHGKTIWLGKFYYDLLIRRKDYLKHHPIEITDKNDEVVLGKFGDFGIMEGGKFCIKDSEGNLVSYGKSLQQVLYKPDAFFNMVKRGRFTIPMDKDGNYCEDIEYKEIPEPLDWEFDDETGKIKKINWSKVRTTEVKKVIAEKIEQIQQLSQELERVEGVVIKQKILIDDLNRSNKSMKIKSDSSETELEKSLFIFHETEKRLSDIHRQNTKLMELKATYESMIQAKDNIIDIVITKMDKFTDPNYELIKTNIMDDLERAKALLPEKITIEQEAPKEEKPIAQPGEVIKK